MVSLHCRTLRTMPLITPFATVIGLSAQCLLTMVNSILEYLPNFKLYLVERMPTQIYHITGIATSDATVYTLNEPHCQKRTFGHVRPAKIQISLRIRAVWSKSSLDAFGIAKNAKFIHADNKDTDKTVWMRRLIWAFVGGMSESTFTQVGAQIFVHVFSSW